MMSVPEAVNGHRKSTSKSPRLERKVKHRRRRKQPAASESDESDESDHESELTDSQSECKSSPAKNQRSLDHRGSLEWEIMEGLKDGQRVTTKPNRQEGYMTKRRKWPMKGWHKRYFVLENGYLSYYKSQSDVAKGKYHGLVDIGLSVLSYKRHGRRIDIDAEDVIYHLKAKSREIFEEWIIHLRNHRLHRQHEISFGSKEAPKLTDVTTPVDDLTPLSGHVSPVGAFAERQRGSFKSRLNLLERSQSKVTAWLMDTAGVDQCNKGLQTAQGQLFELGALMEKLNSLAVHAAASDGIIDLTDFSATKKDKHSRKNFGLWKGHKKDRKSSDANRLSVPTPATYTPAASGGNVSSTAGDLSPGLHQSSSNPNLLSADLEHIRPVSVPDNLVASGHDYRIQEMKLRDDFLTTAKNVHDGLRTLTRTLTTERDRLKHALEQENGVIQGSAPYITALRQALSDTWKQNAEMKAKLQRIHSESSTSGIVSPPPEQQEHPLLAMSVSLESTSEFYDAAEYLISSEGTSEVSEDDEEEEISSEVSDTEDTTAAASAGEEMQLQHMQLGRRSKLPMPKPEADVSLWSLLCKNIGKDLSKISMPVTLNEPLNMLQRLAEELEYSEILDKAAETEDAVDRMVLVAAFSVSPYAGTYYRAGQKPFNPLLGETYECIREDKGWRFIAEQVSHHPPVSACSCESKNFSFWQDIRIKTKFWGKSMEIQPVGTVHLVFNKHRDHYMWNKVTTCVHNLLGGQRWVDHYGEVTIKNPFLGLTCKLTYAKSSYWSDKRHEVYGSITNADGKVVQHIFGKWNEGIYSGNSTHSPSAKCVWRPGSMPEEFEAYYGFTRFAIELNDIVHDQTHFYAPTDTRFRPDQRLLEEGHVHDAEHEKVRVEQIQRDRRKHREEEKVTYSPRWFLRTDEDGKEVYRYAGKYWEMRKDPGFLKIQFPKLW